MYLTDLQSDLWDRYPAARGSVREKVEMLLSLPAPPAGRKQRAAEDLSPWREALEDLCGELSEQMNFYLGAACLVLPYAETLLDRRNGDFAWELEMFSRLGCCLAADVPGNRKGPEPGAELAENYRESRDRLAKRGGDFLKKRSLALRQLDPPERRKICLALFALLENNPWEAFALVMNNWEACCVQCGHCGFLDEDLTLAEGRRQKRLLPVSRRGKDLPEGWLLLRRLTQVLRDRELEHLAAYLYGSCTCPRCGGITQTMQGLTAALDPEQDGPLLPPEETPPSLPEGEPAAAPTLKEPEILGKSDFRALWKKTREP